MLVHHMVWFEDLYELWKNFLMFLSTEGSEMGQTQTFAKS